MVYWASNEGYSFNRRENVGVKRLFRLVRILLKLRWIVMARLLSLKGGCECHQCHTIIKIITITYATDPN